VNSEKLKKQSPFPTKSSSRCLGTTAFPVAVIIHKKLSRFIKQDYLKNDEELYTKGLEIFGRQ
jgi:hypothetical protein